MTRDDLDQLLEAARGDPDPTIAHFAQAAYDHLTAGAPPGPAAPRVECGKVDRATAIP